MRAEKIEKEFVPQISHRLRPILKEKVLIPKVSLFERFGGRGTEKYGKRRENVKNAQSQHRRHLAIAKSHIWRRQVRLKCRLGLILVFGVAKWAVWRSPDGSWSFFFKYQPPPSVLDMSFEVRYTRGIQRNESESTKGADTLRKSISDHLSLYCRYHVDALVYDNLTVPSGRYDTWTFLHYITHDQVRLPVYVRLKLVTLFIYDNYRISDIQRYKKVLLQAKKFTVFVYAHHKTLSLMRHFTKKRDIVRPGVTRFASVFLTLQSLAAKKSQLRQMFTSEDWDKCKFSKTVKGKATYATVVSPSFWAGITLCLKVFAPLVKVLRMVDADWKPSMGFIYGELKKAKKEIIDALGNNKNAYEPVIGIIEAKMKDRLDTCLHLTAYLLNPFYLYNNEEAQNDVEARGVNESSRARARQGSSSARDFMSSSSSTRQLDELSYFRLELDSSSSYSNSIKFDSNEPSSSSSSSYSIKARLVYTLVEARDAIIEVVGILHPEEHELQNHILAVELPMKIRSDSCDQGCEVNDAKYDPANWWAIYGSSTPNLERIATRILSLTTSSSGCERNWSTFEGRNRLETTKVNNLVFVQFNANLMEKNQKRKERQFEVLLSPDAIESGLPWETISEAIGADDVLRPRRSARARELSEEEFSSESEEEDEANEEMEVEYESDGVEIIEQYGEDDNGASI
ncbi:hypothetical protein OSB04_024219 [Centaurea solstitialis]|uniref:HAT C-terminal dimerisation domain-containing protein n=1 Tax=Centaurea solstitialis TaxID=347529 RepID=A0AA38T458_9ASTR|nr:hypothetical protein OSB04_024219 [Centaurea solstitialis]